MIKIDPDQEDFFYIIIGIALGSAFNKQDMEFAYSIVKFVNKASIDNPNFKPYFIPEKYR